MRLLLPDVFQYRLAKRAQRIASVDDMNDDVRRVDDLVELAIDTARGSFRIDRLNDICVRLEVVGTGRRCDEPVLPLCRVLALLRSRFACLA